MYIVVAGTVQQRCGKYE